MGLPWLMTSPAQYHLLIVPWERDVGCVEWKARFPNSSKILPHVLLVLLSSYLEQDEEQTLVL